MSLWQEIDRHAKTVSTTSYSISIGELISMYQDKEIIIRPEYQRLYRWQPEQKSIFIESLLLDIPLPAIFVAENEDSRWEIIDGLQRVSTILETVGALIDKDGNKINPLKLLKTKYLESLEGMLWESEDTTKQLPDQVKIKLKRARIDVYILKKSSDKLAKYEIFQRLNTGGTTATPQEVRNCIALMYGNEFYNFTTSLSSFPQYRECFAFSDKQTDEAFDQELVTRFIVFLKSTVEELTGMTELGTYLTDKMTAYAQDTNFDYTSIRTAFENTFSYLSSVTGDDSFKKYDIVKNRYLGQSLVSLYEIIAIGLGINYYCGKNAPDPDEFKSRHKSIWETTNRSISAYIGSGVRASTRVPRTIAFGKGWIDNDTSQNT